MAEDRINGRFAPGIRPVGAGRPAGTPNKRTQEFQQTLEKNNFNAAATWLEMINEAREFLKYGDREAKMEAIKVITDITSRIADRLYPKLKAIEYAPGNQYSNLSNEEKLEMLRAATRALEDTIDRSESGDVSRDIGDNQP